ncbi:MAG: sigma-70 family RNA polymerase sigma factor [Candidatus Marinimicrobia bacterium]|nr:sigma-70 family RNA polymerase sigma factor [Candidatus Neomarinimicrobiota bacterium]
MAFTLVPVVKEDLIDREEILGELYDGLSDPGSTTGYAIFGKRRIGKTSILKELQLRLQETAGIVPVYFSVWDLVEPSLLEFCKKLSIEILEGYSFKMGIGYRIGELLRTPISVIKQILGKAEFKVIYKEIELLLSFKTEANLDRVVENTFTRPERISKDMKCVLLIDEFPSIIDLKVNNSVVGESIIRKIRSISENWKRTALCISGSIRSTIKTAVLSSASPFYRQLIVREVGPLEKKWVRELIVRNLPNISDEVIDEIYEFSHGIPFYVQFLGKMLERKKGKISINVVKQVEQEFLREEGNIIFKEEFEKMSPKERLIILAIAYGFHTPKEIAKQVGDKVSNVNRFLFYLKQKGQVYKKEKGMYEIEDPVFTRWIREMIHG